MDRFPSSQAQAEPGAPHFRRELSNSARLSEGMALNGRFLRLRSPSSQVRGVRFGIMNTRLAKYAIGQVVRHRIYPFRGVIFDVDPTFSNTEEYWLSIPEHIRPRKDQPFYHLLAENDESSYVAYVSEQNLLPDDTGMPVGHPQAQLIFESFGEGQYKLRPRISH
jgi:heat shock protein HspQ